MKASSGKVRTVMHEFKTGKLKSSSGQKVKNPRQAVAIAMSEAGMSRKRHFAEGGIRKLASGGVSSPRALPRAPRSGVDMKPAAEHMISNARLSGKSPIPGYTGSYMKEGGSVKKEAERELSFMRKHHAPGKMIKEEEKEHGMRRGGKVHKKHHYAHGGKVHLSDGPDEPVGHPETEDRQAIKIEHERHGGRIHHPMEGMKHGGVAHHHAKHGHELHKEHLRHGEAIHKEHAKHGERLQALHAKHGGKIHEEHAKHAEHAMRGMGVGIPGAVRAPRVMAPRMAAPGRGMAGPMAGPMGGSPTAGVLPGMRRGGKVHREHSTEHEEGLRNPKVEHHYAKGGHVLKSGPAKARHADGIASRGRTRGKVL